MEIQSEKQSDNRCNLINHCNPIGKSPVITKSHSKRQVIIMGRLPRQTLTGGIYHIIQRGHNKSYIFNDQMDKLTFLDLIKKCKTESQFHVLFYVLMDNHYHLIIEIQGLQLGTLMKRINQAYSRYYHQKHSCSGTVYGTRYRVFPVTDKAYFIQLLKYIAHNPVKAGIVRHPTEYRWSAHMEIASTRGTIVSTKRLFEILGGNLENGSKNYDTLIRQNVTAGSSAQDQKSFDAEYRAQNLANLLDDTIKGQITIAIIRSASRDAKTASLRCEFIRKATEQGYSVPEIARALKKSDRYVRNWRNASQVKDQLE